MNWKSKHYWLVVTLLAAAAIYTQLIRADLVHSGKAVNLSVLPQQVGDWLGQDQLLSQDIIATLKSDQLRMLTYTNSQGKQITLYVSYWASQKYGAQPHSPLHCVPGSGWNITSRETIRLDATNSQSASLIIIDNNQYRQAMLYWYQTRTGTVANELAVKLQLATNSLLRKPTDVAFVRLTTAIIDGDDQKASQLLRSFWQQVEPDVMRSLDM